MRTNITQKKLKENNCKIYSIKLNVKLNHENKTKKKL